MSGYSMHDQQYVSLINALSPKQIACIADENKDWAHVNGVCMRMSDQKDKSDVVQILPFTLLPSVTPKELFLEAYDVQKDFNILYHNVAFDENFITTCLKRVVKTDPFTRGLYQIYKTIMDEECMQRIQPFVLTVQRSDYMFHNIGTSCAKDNETSPLDSYILKQVEVNNIAAGGAGLATKVTQMHKQALKQWAYVDPVENAAKIPNNQALDLVSRALAAAWMAYGNKKAVLLVIVEDLNQNAMDQRMVEFQFSALTGARSRRLTLAQCFDQIDIDFDRCNRICLRDEDLEVAVIYFRSGYSPKHYPTEKEWQARLMLERSAAIKCPWIGAHLAGTKKVQQVLTKMDLATIFGLTPLTEKRVKNTFAGIYSLDSDDPKTDEIKLYASKWTQDFVLKPQLEGGGNNIYGSDIIQTFKEKSCEELEAYILMQRLCPLVHENVLVKNGAPLTKCCVDSELGVFGFALGNKEVIVKQGHFGHIIRTKPSTFNEGGISTGAAAHDAAFLV